MIYLGTDIINKIGNGNKIYLGDRMIYQNIYKGEVISTLPDVPFLFNYNAKQYLDGIIPNAKGALFDSFCALSYPENVEYTGDSLKINSVSSFSKLYESADENPFNRTAGQPLTIIAKVKGVQGKELHLFANRCSNYNYMFRIGQWNSDIAWLHTLYTPQLTVPFDFSQPNIITIRCGTDNYGYMENRTTGEVGDKNHIIWGGKSDGFALLSGFANDDGETFVGGEFYWIYISPEQLTDEEIKQVIRYNETM